MRFLRMYRASLLLAGRPAVLVFAVLAMLVVVAVSLSSRDYANDQLDVVANAEVNTCAELAERGVDEGSCAQVQQSQADSAEFLNDLAADIGPSAATLATPRGGISLVLGHALSAVGMVLVGLVVAVSYSTEQLSGVSRVRERMHSSWSANVSRLLAAVTVWLLWAAVCAVVAVRLDGLSPDELITDYQPVDALAGTTAILGRLAVGLAGSLIVAAVVLSVRRWIRARPAVVALATFGTIAVAAILSMALPMPLTPLGAQLTSQTMGDDPAFIDHLPFVEFGDPGRTTSVLALAGWLVAAGAAFRLSCREPV